MVGASDANYNNEIGCRSRWPGSSRPREVLVCELAMRGMGQIAQLAALCRPDVGVITTSARCIWNWWARVEGVAEAKAEILDRVAQTATLVVPAAEPLLRAPPAATAGGSITFGEDPGADVRLVDVRPATRIRHPALVEAFDRARGLAHRHNAIIPGGWPLAAFMALGWTLEEAEPGAVCGGVLGAARRQLELPGGGLLIARRLQRQPGSP